ncbi:uncharacterized protein LOC126410444 [Nymphaea colorata]|uniref:uncharacterized protein LOC126410444 n=1 Tax=Nymphaea colorata TaxID=210225 RepID=UPI00214E3F28|nr:uncharacterized protein LOC126410444 [Nymphaea colorata]
MGLCDLILGRMFKVLVVVSIFLFAAVTYFQVRVNENPLDSAFSVAVFITTMISIAFTFYSQSLSEKEKERSVKTVVGLFTLTGAGFLIRAWMVVPTERAWVVPLSCVVPAVAALAFMVLHRRLGGLEAGK